MIDLFDSSIFGALVYDRRFFAAVGAAVLAGVMRGFSGFGSALIYIPLIAAIYEPRLAAGTLLLIDLFSGAPFAARVVRQCEIGEVLPLTIAAVLGVPLGTTALLLADPVILRWAIAGFVLVMLVIIRAGRRYHGHPWWPITAAVGFLSGFFGGAFQMEGPLVAVFLLGGANNAARVRANLMVFIALTGLAVFLAYLIAGVLTVDVCVLAILLGVPFIAAMSLGDWLFHGVPERAYRPVALIIVASAVLSSLPIFDGLR